jgi:hypothetical protein
MLLIFRELKCMDWGTGQKLLSTWGQRVKTHVLNTIIVFTCNPSTSLSRYDIEILFSFQAVSDLSRTR